MEPNKTFIIKHKVTGELFRARSGKTSWKAPGHAKNAFGQSIHSWNITGYGLSFVEYSDFSGAVYTRAPKFNEQDVWEIVELKVEASTKLEKAVALLNLCLGRCDYDMQKEIEKFLEGVE